MPEAKGKRRQPKSTVTGGEISVYNPHEYAREMDRVFSDFERRMEHAFGTSFGGTLLLPRWRSWDFPEVRRPFTDLIDTGTDYRVRVEVPGIPKEKLNVSVTPKEIRVDGEAESNIDEKKEGFVRRERSYSKVRRDLTFPEEVVPDKAEANVKDGILEVKIPKKTPTEAKTHKVEIT